VTDSTGVPLAGVQVTIYDCMSSWVTYGYTDASGSYTTYDAIAPGSYYAVTWNSMGYLDELYDDMPCPGGSCSASTGTAIGVTAGSTTSGIDFALGPGGRIAGTVTDSATGSPLTDVDIDVYDSGGSYVAYGYTDATGAYSTTGLPAGVYYAVTWNWAGYVDELHANVPCPNGSCTPTTGTPITLTAGATTTVDFGLAPGGRVTGTVTSAATGLPLSSVQVRIYNSGGSQVTNAYTDASGVYTSRTGLPTGTYYARTSNSLGYVEEVYNDVSCPFASCTVTSGAPITVTLGSTTTGIDFALTPGGRISGTVTDAGTSTPLASVSVYVYGSSGSQVTSGYTDSSGSYVTYTGLPTGTYYARTSNYVGYLDELYSDLPCAGGSCTATGGTPISVTQGTTTGGVDFGLVAGGRISGTVTDAATSQPLANQQVRIFSSSGWSVGSGYTDCAGVYTTQAGLPAGTYYARTENSLGYIDELYDDVSCPGGSCSTTSGTPITVALGATTAAIDFALAMGGRISGTVTDAGTGLPLQSVEVDIYSAGGSWAGYGYTNAAGVYTSYSGLVSGTYYALTWNSQGYLDELYNNISCPSASCTPTSGTPITVTVGTTTAGVSFGLVKGGRISGTVTDAATGAPLQSVQVRILNSGGSQVTYGYTNSSGVYTSNAGLVAGTYYARTYNSQGYIEELYDNISCPGGSCSQTGGTAISVSLGSTRTGVDFGLVKGGRITGTVTDAATALPLAGVSVLVYDSGGTQLTSGYTSGSGVYTTSSGLPAGTYYARTSNSLGYFDELYDDKPCADGNCSVTTGTAVAVTSGATVTGIDFALSPGGRVSGTVTDAATGLPLANVEVDVYSSTGLYVSYSTTNSAGVYTSRTALASGTFYVRTWNSQGYFDELFDDVPCPAGSCSITSGTPVSVTAGATTGGIDFDLARGARISGTVTDHATGLPVADVGIDIYNAAGWYVTYAYTDGTGVYASAGGLTPGTYYAKTYNSAGYIDELYDNTTCLGSACSVLTGTPITVTTGTTTGVDFALGKGGAISGIVTDAATGLPLPNVSVYVLDSAGKQITSGYSSSSGTYMSRSGLVTGTYYLRTYNSSGYLDELYNNLPCPGGQCTVTSGTPVSVVIRETTGGISFALAKGGRISGTITDAATSQPLSGVYVYVYNASGVQITYGSTDGSGVYASRSGLPTGTYYARTYNSLGYADELYDNIPCPGGMCTLTSGTPVAVTAGATRTGVDFALPLGGRISGTVRDSGASAPLAGVTVYIYNSAGTHVAYGSSDSSGTYLSYSVLAPGTYYARTLGALGYVDELYDDIACPGGACVVTVGTGIIVTGGTTTTGIDFALAPNPGYDFYTVTPCRVVDTRDPNGPLGGPILVAGSARSFTISGPKCGIPATAKAVSVNVTVTGATQNGNVRLYPAGTPTPTTSTINYVAGVTRANNATITLNASGETAVLASPSGSVHFILDVNGYYRSEE
jgi:hypothetical protein